LGRGRLLLTALAAVFALAAPAGAATSNSPELSRLATAFQGRPIVAYCAKTQADWSGTLVARHIPSYVVGFAYIGRPRVWLSPSICAGVPQADPWSVLVFLHELIHTSGVRNERTANCRALAGEQSFLENLLGLSPEQAQSVYEKSLAKALAEPPAYRPLSC
jgi:hypothetical protein